MLNSGRLAASTRASSRTPCTTRSPTTRAPSIERAVARAAARCSSRTSPRIRTGRPSSRDDARQRRAQPRGRAPALPGRARSARLSLTSPAAGDLNSLQAPRAPGGPAALLHGGQAQRGRAATCGCRPSSRRSARPSIPSSSGASARRCFDGLERTAGDGERRRRRDGAHRLPRRLPALRARRHPRLVDAAGVGHPGRPPRPARRSPAMSSAPPTSARPCPSSTSSPIASTRYAAEIEVSLRSGRRDGHDRLPPDGDRGALRPPPGLRPRGARAHRGVPRAPSIRAWARSTRSAATSTRA